jgi:hypothetical protein
MLNPDLLPDRVFSDIAENLDLEDDDRAIEEIKQLSFWEGFDRFLTWNGIIHYTTTLVDAVKGLLAAEVPVWDESEVDGSIIHNGKLLEFAETTNIVDDLQVGEVLIITRLANGHFYARRMP